MDDPRFSIVALAGGMLVALGVMSVQAAPGASLELTLSAAADAGVEPVPVRTGVPMSPGALVDERNVRLLVDGRETDLQTEVLARYNDRSVKWLLMDFRVAPTAKLKLEFGKGVRPKAVGRSIKVAQDAAGVTIDTGRLKATIRKDGVGLMDEISLDLNGDGEFAGDERLPSAKGARANWMDFVHAPTITSRKVMSAAAVRGQVDPSRVEITELKVEVAGPLRAIVKLAGNYRYKKVGKAVTYPYPNPQYRDTRPKDVGRIPFVMRLHFFRGSGSVEIQHTFIYEGDPDRDFPTELALAAPMPTSSDAVVTIGTEKGVTRLTRGKSSAIGLSQTSADTSRIWKTTPAGAPGIVSQSGRAPGWMDVSNKRWGVTAAIWRSWQQYPKGFVADAGSGQLQAQLWPAGAGPMCLRRYTRRWGVSETGARGGIDPFSVSRHVSRGVAKTHRVLLDFHAGPAKDESIPPRIAWFRQKLRAWPPADYLCRLQAHNSAAISPVEPGKYDHLEKIITDCLDWMLFNRERFRWYGMLDYGDLQQCYQNVHHHGRWESDYGRWGWFNGDASGNKPYKALLTHFLRTGRRDIFDMFEAEILHIIDVDMVNSEEYPWNDEGWRDMRGCGHRHNGQHWACFFVGSRAARVTSFAQLYYFTGDERLRDALDIFAEAAWKELGVGRAGRGGHSSTQDMTSRLYYRLERTGEKKVRDLIAAKWSWLLNSNRGAAELAAAAKEEDDLDWVRTPAKRALTPRRDYRYPGTVIVPLTNAIRYLQGKEDVKAYRAAIDKAVAHMQQRYRAGPQGLPRDQWPGPIGGPIQGNWNPIPNHMPLAIHALRLNDAAKKGGK